MTNQIKALTFKQKDELLKQVFSQYQKTKLQLDCLKQREFYPTIEFDVIRDTKNKYHTSMVSRLNNHIEDKEELQGIVDGFEQILDYLSPQARDMIEREYLRSSRKEWWIEYYSRSTFYRIKTRAMEEMLFYLNI